MLPEKPTIPLAKKTNEEDEIDYMIEFEENIKLHNNVIDVDDVDDVLKGDKDEHER
jgi:hypothetical protein